MGASKIINPATAGGLPPAGVFGTGSINTLAKFTGATTIANSGVSDDGATVSFVARNLASTALQTTWTLPSDASALTLGGVLTLNTSQKRLGINCAPGTLLSVSDGTVSAPSYDGIRLGRMSEALFSSTDSVLTFRAGVTGSTVVVGSASSHDVLLQRNSVTALTLGASGVTFAGNLTSSLAQTWTLAAGSTSALNIQSGLLNLDTTNSRVGIGTTSPQEKLQVYGDLKVGVLASGSYISLGDEATTQRLIGIFRAPGDTLLGVGGYAGIKFTVGAVGLGSQTERMRITSTGDVGIGTASPGAPLDVALAAGGGNNTARLIYTGALTANEGAVLGLGGYYTGTTATTFAYIKGAKDTITSGDYGGHLEFWTRPNGGSFAQQMTITSAGNVGLGTASPAGRLHVVGGTAAAATNGAPVTIIAQSAGTGNQNGGNIVLTPGSKTGTGTDGLVDLSSPSGTGLKLPAAPGNGDAQTLDCYQEGSTSSTSLTTGITTTSGAITTSIGWTRIGRSVKIDITIAPAAGQSLTLANPWYVVGTGVPSVSASSPVMSICTSLGAVRSNGYVYNSGVTPVFYAFSLGILAADEKVFISVTTQS